MLFSLACCGFLRKFVRLFYGFVMKQIQRYLYIPLLVLMAVVGRADRGTLFSSGRLTSNQVNCVGQDAYGYIWIGTNYGLNRFDGYHYTHYLHKNNDSSTLIDNIVTCFLVDKNGSLWIGLSKGLVRYDYHGDSFVNYPFPGGRTPRVYSLLVNKEGDILIGTAGYGLYSIRNGEGSIRSELEYSRRPVEQYFSRLYEDRKGRLWRSSHEDLFTCYEVSGRQPVDIRDFESPCGAPVAFVDETDSTMFIVCMNGILQYNDRQGTISDVNIDKSGVGDNLIIRTAMADRAGNLYIGTANHGLLSMRKGTSALTNVDYSAEDFHLGTASVTDVMEDRDGNLWVGCNNRGVFLINQQQPMFKNWNLSSQQVASGGAVTSITPSGDGGLYCVVQNSGVYHFNAEGTIVAHPTSPAGAHFIYRDTKGNYWLGTDNTLYAYQPVSGTYQERLRLEGDHLQTMVDDGNNLYISDYSRGLTIYNLATGEHHKKDMNQRDGKGFLCNNWIRDMMIDSRGLLWMCTASGVCCMSPDTESFVPFGWNSLLREVQANAVCENVNGNIVLATENGVFIFLVDENRVERFANSEVLDDKQVGAIVSDLDGNLWFATTEGIWQYRHSEDDQFVGHLNGNGLSTREYTLGAKAKRADGYIAFGSGIGITVFQPREVSGTKANVGSLHLTRFLVDGKAHDMFEQQDEESDTTQKLVAKQHFSLPYSENSFTMEFSLLKFKDDDHIRLAYRVNGGEEQLTDEGVNMIPFNKLEPGEYQIEVRAVDNGVRAQQPTTIWVRVANPWYTSPLAFFFYFLLAAALLAGVLMYYRRKSKRDLDEAKMRFLIDATHDIRSPLTLILGPLKNLKRKVHDEESKADIETIDRNANRLLLLVNQILDERKIDKNQMQLKCEPTNLVAYIKGVCSLYQYHARSRNIQLSFEHDDTVVADIDRKQFDKVVNNLLSNAFKYTADGGEIVVDLRQEKQQVILTVSDTGIGFNNEDTSKLFERFYQGKNTSGFHVEGTGIGLNLTRSLVLLHGGTIKARNRNDGKKGAVMTVTLPASQTPIEQLTEVTQENHDSMVNHIDLWNMDKGTQKVAKVTILVVDDDRELAQFIRRELADWYRVDTCPNGKMALEALLKGNYDLVVSDVIMPEMDGITLLKKIKSNSLISHIPVVLLTSKAEVSDRMEGIKHGADAFLAKPFSIEELHLRIDNLIANVRRLKGKFSGAQQQEQQVERVEMENPNDVLMRRIMKCVNEHLSDSDFNVEDLTREVGISRAQLHRKMKEITGISTGEFIRNLRLEQAARIIREQNVNITQVAYAVGFNNANHFSTIFKRHFGMTPSEYKERGSIPSSLSQEWDV